jgi:hypothetical protein
MAVLQGKSRDVIIKELQRTNLDVNMAVNNLLSREEGDHEEHEEQFPGMLSSEDFVVLGSGVMDEADFDLPATLIRRLRERDRDLEMADRRGRESRASLRDFSPYTSSGSSRGPDAAGSSSSSSSSQPKKVDSGPSSVQAPYHEWWPNYNRFVDIAAMHTALLAIDENGLLHYFEWNNLAPYEAEPGEHAHPRAAELGLTGESVIALDASYLRASVLTTSGKIASWLDPHIANHACRLEHSAQLFSELSGETVTELKVSSLFTVAITHSKKAYWWGFPPVAERRQLVEKAREKKKKLKMSQEHVIAEGSEVCLRNCPLYEAGTRVVLLNEGPPKLGQLVGSMYNVVDTFDVKGIGAVTPTKEKVEKPQLGVKRRRSEGDGSDYSDYEEGEGTRQLPPGPPYEFNIEKWEASNTLFLEDSGICGPVGKVIKVDGRYAAVLFNNRDGPSSSDVLASCRLLKKDDLMTSQEAKVNHSQLCYQDSPKRITFSPDCKVLAFSVTRHGVFVLAQHCGVLRVGRVDMVTGKISEGGKFPDIQSHHFSKQLKCSLLKLPTKGNEYLLQDETGGIYVLAERDSHRGLKDIVSHKLPPVQCVDVCKTSAGSMSLFVAIKTQSLMTSLVKGEVGKFTTMLGEICKLEGREGVLLNEVLSGGNNILHVLSEMSAPAPSSQGGSESKSSSAAMSMRDLFRRAHHMASSSSPTMPHPLDYTHYSSSDEGESDTDHQSSLKCIRAVKDAAVANPQVFIPLMCAKNIDGMTPFMYAVYNRSYQIGIELFQLAMSLTKQQSMLMSMLFPSTCHPDDSPLFVLCHNDSCSFTWTGEEHVSQDIFECRTCGIVDSYCCCTECAYTCHRGHDCSFKKALPTAYCDCWQKCKCRALPPGNTSQRKKLLQLLLTHTSLASLPNARGEHIISMLVALVARQAKEQVVWGRLKAVRESIRSRSKPDVPANDLKPPNFAVTALKMCCEQWEWLKACLSSGCEDHLMALKREGALEALRQASSVDLVDIFRSHSSAHHLDALTYNILAKLPLQHLLHPLKTLVAAIEGKEPGAEELGKRFVRSVIRVFTLCSLDSSSTTQTTSSKKKSSSASAVEHAQIVFQSLSRLACKEIIDMATSLITMVTTGTCRSLTLTISTDRDRMMKAVEDLFALPPPTLLRTPSQVQQPLPSNPHPPPSPLPPARLAPEMEGDSDEEMEGDPLGMESDVSLSEYDDVDSDHEDDEWVMMDTGAPDTTATPSSRLDTHREPLPAGTQDHGHWAVRQRSEASSIPPRSKSGNRTEEAPLSAAILIAKSFNSLLRIFTKLINSPEDKSIPSLKKTPCDASVIWAKLEPTLQWVISTLDITEKQLRLGNAVRVVTKSPLSDTPSTSSTPDDHLTLLSLAYSNSGLVTTDPLVLAARRDCLAYLNSLMRWSKDEHGGLLPSIDVSQMEHVAIVLEGFLCLLCKIPASGPVTMKVNSVEEGTDRFFRRSQSITCLSLPPAHPFESLSKSIPLAEKPHLLQPTATKKELFGADQPTLEQWPTCSLDLPPYASPLANPLSAHRTTSSCTVLSDDAVLGVSSNQLTAGVMLGRWSSCIELFVRSFGDSFSSLSASVLGDYSSYKEKEKSFRKVMESLRSNGGAPFSLEVDRNSERLLTATVHEISTECEILNKRAGGLQYWQPSSMDITFRNEPGEGVGVRRSFFTAIAEVVLSQDNQMPHILDGIESILKGESRVTPLFYQPGRTGHYAPSYGAGMVASPKMSTYRCVGRLIGLALLHGELFPLKLCRHVLKYLIGRPILWHDFAFYDSTMYESLRKMIVEAEKPSGEQQLCDMHLTFQVQLREEEGGGVHDLCVNGGAKAVTVQNVREYVQQYALLRMVTWCEPVLKELKSGLNDILPESLLKDVTAEDFNLLINGSPVVDVDVLKKITSFTDESHQTADTVSKFKQWFWAIVEKMTNEERHDLINFWTSSPSMPADPRSYQPQPSVTLRPADEVHLPTANTCISRLYIPVYSSKQTLKAKLLQAITTKVFGFV